MRNKAGIFTRHAYNLRTQEREMGGGRKWDYVDKGEEEKEGRNKKEREGRREK